jgi:hypothetical protein
MRRLSSFIKKYGEIGPQYLRLLQSKSSAARWGRDQTAATRRLQQFKKKHGL